MGADKEASYRLGLKAATLAAAEVLKGGGHALESAIAAVRHMELSGAFNAGLGSCLTEAGIIETDAAVMDGADLSYGAVAAVPELGNAVEVAEGIRKHSAHCLFAGPSALKLAHSLPGVTPTLVEPSPSRLRAWQAHVDALKGQEIVADTLGALGGTHDEGDTVGAVVLDGQGHLAAAGSTGGIWLKKSGRVGDSPIAGAGLWAEDGLMACAATGTGEFIMRAALSADIRARCQSGQGMPEAGQAALNALRARFGPGRAGLIGVDSEGRISTAFDTAGMGRATMRASEAEPTVLVWPEEDEVPEAGDSQTS
jgi:beta-aspartyl-peptidase (threonine type)